MASAIFPDKKVKVGDTWEISTKVESGFTLNLVTKYTLKSMDKESYTIEGIAKGTTDNTYFEDNGVYTKYDLQGDVISTIILDKKTGWTKDAKISEIFNGTTGVKYSEDSTEESSLPINIKNEIVISDN